MIKYKVVNTGRGHTPFEVHCFTGEVKAVFREESRANKCAAMLEKTDWHLPLSDSDYEESKQLSSKQYRV